MRRNCVVDRKVGESPPLKCLKRTLLCKWIAGIHSSYVLDCICLYIIISCKQYVSRTNLWIFTKFIADTSYILSWKRLTSDAGHSHLRRLTFSHFSFSHILDVSLTKRRAFQSHSLISASLSAPVVHVLLSVCHCVIAETILYVDCDLDSHLILNGYT